MAQVEKEKRRLAAIAAAEQKAKQAQSWIGWLPGAKVSASANAEDAEMRGDLNDEEAAKLQELVDERDAAIQAGMFCLLSSALHRHHATGTKADRQQTHTQILSCTV